MSKLAKILSVLIALGPKAPEVIAILRRIYADAMALYAIIFPDGLPSLDPLPDGTLGLTLHESYSEEEIALEGQLFSLVAEHSDTQEFVQAGALLKMLAFLDRLGLTDALLGLLLSKLGK